MLVALVILALHIVPTFAHATDDMLRDRDAAFQQAQQHLEAGRYRAGIWILRRLNEAYPGAPGVVWNLAYATSELGDHREALTYWLAFRSIEPNDWHVHSRLVQTYQALGDTLARDRERETLYRPRKSAPAGSELAKLDRYVREQTTIAGKRVMVVEYFEPSGSRRVFYSFHVLTDGGDEAFRLSLGSYEWTTQFAWESGALPRDQRVYHLDRYDRTKHSTYAFFDGVQPSYEAVRALVEEILTGKRRPVSTSPQGKRAPGGRP